MAVTRSNGSSKATKGKSPEPVEYEFFGPIGTFALLFILPGVVYFLYFSCNESGCTSVYPTLSFPETLNVLPSIDTLFSVRGAQIFLGWFAFQAFLYIALPGPWVQGTELRDGTRLEYKMNGVWLFELAKMAQSACISHAVCMCACMRVDGCGCVGSGAGWVCVDG